MICDVGYDVRICHFHVHGKHEITICSQIV